MSEETTKPRRGRPPKNPTVNETLSVQPDHVGEVTGMVPHHPPITEHGFRDEALKQWLLDYYPDLANLALTGRISNHTQP